MLIQIARFLIQLHSDAASLHKQSPAALRTAWRLMIVSVLLMVSGCQSNSVVSENPVFSDLPPRRSLVNHATNERSSDKDRALSVTQVAISDEEPLQGNTVVAEINGRPLFVDDLIGSIRLTLEADDRYTDRQRRQLMLQELERGLDQRIDEEIVLQALEVKVPEEQQEALKEHLRTAFEQFLEARKVDLIKEGKITSGDELDEFLAQSGLSVGLLRESFFRIQMVNGYIKSLTDEIVNNSPDRLQLLEYYRKNIDQFTPAERVRWQEIRVSISDHGGRKQARQRMMEVLTSLKSGETEFGELALRYSDVSSARQNGNRGWLNRDSLRDKKLEEALFNLKSGGTTSVIEDDTFFSIYRVARHEYARPRPFSVVQSEIEEKIRKEWATTAQKKIITDMRAVASVQTIFDDDAEIQ
ncbi:MAG: peptidylprolyl isomerase [Fuerstiella sp.]|nr:peptidylprolyl isomerase [Fuerstiella sp.]